MVTLDAVVCVVCVFVINVLSKFTVCDQNKPGASICQQLGKYILLLFVVTSSPLGIDRLHFSFCLLFPFHFCEGFVFVWL